MNALRARGSGVLHRPSPATLRSWLRPRAQTPAAWLPPATAAHSLADVQLTMQLRSPEGGGASGTDGGTDAGPVPADGGTTATLSPYRVMFSMAQISNEACRIPEGSNGAAKLARYRVVAAEGGRPGRITVGEQFSSIEDPYSVFAALHPNRYTTEPDGTFDDCYSLSTRQDLPDDFRLKVEQNHLIGGQIASKQHITFTRGNVFLCVFERRADAFPERCRRY